MKEVGGASESQGAQREASRTASAHRPRQLVEAEKSVSGFGGTRVCGRTSRVSTAGPCRERSPKVTGCVHSHGLISKVARGPLLATDGPTSLSGDGPEHR
jgi:hypothetical protein